MTSCEACRRGDKPTQHVCIACNTFVHVFDTCSKNIPGQDEGSGEKRMLFDCEGSLDSFRESFCSDDSNQSKQNFHANKENKSRSFNEDDNKYEHLMCETNLVPKKPFNTIENSDKVKEEVKKPKFQDYFEYRKIEKIKYGMCLICGKDSKENFKVSIKMTNSNTSGLKSHLMRKHEEIYKKMFLSDMTSSKTKKDGTVAKDQLTLDAVLKNNAVGEVSANRMIVSWLGFKNLPKSFFDDVETQNFFSWLNNKISMPKKNQANNIIIEEFEKMQMNLKNILLENESKFAFTVDAWSSKTRKSYYGITIHFIDKHWVLHSCTLDFVPSSGRHAGIDIAQIFINVLEFYNIANKITGITVDNASANTKFMEELGSILQEKNISFDIKDQHFRCLSHVLNLSVQDILNLMEIGKKNNDNFDSGDDFSDKNEQDNEDESGFIAKVVKKIRQLHNKIRNSEILNKKLENCCDVCDIKFKKPISDSKTRWNSTYDMLQVAYHLKNALDMLCKNNNNIGNFSISVEEWNFLKQMIDFLRYFKNVSEKISGEKYVTLPEAVIAFNCLLDKIEKKCFELDKKKDRQLDDEQLILAFQKGRDKLIKHYYKCNWIYCISLILDPRIKADGLDLTEWGRDMKDKFKSLFKEYYDKYAITQNEIVESSSKKRKTTDTDDDSIDFNVLFLKPMTTLVWEKEMNNYLNSPIPGSNTDILVWWKNYTNVFPIVSRMARDILCLPATSVPVERVFSEASLVITKNRCSLKDESLSELICINRWMKSSLKKEICEIPL